MDTTGTATTGAADSATAAAADTGGGADSAAGAGTTTDPLDGLTGAGTDSDTDAGGLNRVGLRDRPDGEAVVAGRGYETGGGFTVPEGTQIVYQTIAGEIDRATRDAVIQGEDARYGPAQIVSAGGTASDVLLHPDHRPVSENTIVPPEDGRPMFLSELVGPGMGVVHYVGDRHDAMP